MLRRYYSQKFLVSGVLPSIYSFTTHHALSSSQAQHCMQQQVVVPAAPCVSPAVVSHIACCASASSAGTRQGESVPESQRAAPGPYQQVGNVFIVQCIDLPAKHSPAINLLLRELRLEFKGQWVVQPDVPKVREKLFRVRHVVRVEMVPVDEMKQLLGIPRHVNFSDLTAGLPLTQLRGPSFKGPYNRAHYRFNILRRARMKDILARDQVELRLLREKKKLLEAAEPQN